MLGFIALLCLVGALILLISLSYIDLKEGLLPNELVMGLLASGLVFHLTLMFSFLEMRDMALGAFIGGGILYVIRAAANYYYEDDALGLGDVKLMGAGGLWLGPEGILLAMTIGAIIGFVHGLSVAIFVTRRAGVKSDLSKFSIPAGPGFAVGLIGTAIYQFRDFPGLLPFSF